MIYYLDHGTIRPFSLEARGGSACARDPNLGQCGSFTMMLCWRFFPQNLGICCCNVHTPKSLDIVLPIPDASVNRHQESARWRSLALWWEGKTPRWEVFWLDSVAFEVFIEKTWKDRVGTLPIFSEFSWWTHGMKIVGYRKWWNPPNEYGCSED